MEKKTDYSKMSYQELENEINQILSNLQDDGLSLDEQIKIGEKGQKVLAEMGKRLDALKEKVDKISSSSTKGSDEEQWLKKTRKNQRKLYQIQIFLMSKI